MKKVFMGVIGAVLASSALAKLPPPSPEAKTKAEVAAAKTAWQGKVDAYQLCLAQDRVASKYRGSAAAAGKTPPPAVATPACTDPGPLASAGAAASAQPAVPAPAAASAVVAAPAASSASAAKP